MNAALNWRREQDTLYLQGALESNTLLPLWEQRRAVTDKLSIINIKAITRVDTAGLALLIQLVADAHRQGGQAVLTGVGHSVKTLAQLSHLPHAIFPLEN